MDHFLLKPDDVLGTTRQSVVQGTNSATAFPYAEEQRVKQTREGFNFSLGCYTKQA